MSNVQAQTTQISEELVAAVEEGIRKETAAGKVKAVAAGAVDAAKAHVAGKLPKPTWKQVALTVAVAGAAGYAGYVLGTSGKLKGILEEAPVL